MSLFWIKTNQKNESNKIVKKSSLRNETIMKLFIFLNWKWFKRRISLLFSFQVQAGMALEGCLVIPIFIFFMMSIIYPLSIIRLQSNIILSLHQVGNEISFSGYQYIYDNEARCENKADGDISFVNNKILDYLNSDMLKSAGLDNQGISYQNSKIMHENDIVFLSASYGVKPFIYWLKLNHLQFEHQYYAHAWTGYDLTLSKGNTKEYTQYVYVTQTGTVYHQNRNCTYLNLSIQAVGNLDLIHLRNKNGAKYYICELCTIGGNTLYYITFYGDRYHSNLNCSGLKRTIFMITLQEAKENEKHACSKCSK